MALRAFVTGATGFLGLNVVEQLVRDGWDVTALCRHSSDTSTLSTFPVRQVIGVLEDADSIRNAVPEGVDAVFHVAADVNFWKGGNAQQTKTNVDGTRNLVDAAIAKRVGRLIHTSSAVVYFPSHVPFCESSPKNARGSWINYASTKYESEMIVLDAIGRGLDAVVTNPSNIVGRYDKSSWGRLFRLIPHRKLPGIGRANAPFCWAEAVAKAQIQAFHRGRTGENYLLAGTQNRYSELTQIIGELVAAKPPRSLPASLIRLSASLSNIGSTLTRKAPDLTPEIAFYLTNDMVVQSDKSERELGYTPVPLRAMLEDCHEWLVSNSLALDTKKVEVAL